MIRKIYQIGEPLLYEKTKPVKDFNSDEVKSIIKDLIDTSVEEEERSAGLSANQIGASLSICVCRRMDLEEEGRKKHGKDFNLSRDKLWKVFINPKIINSTKDKSVFWEGCLSVGEKEEDTLYGPVWRPEDVEVEYYDEKGVKKTIEARGFFSHLVQHEIDHLNGKLFVSQVPNPEKNLWRSTELEEYIKREGEHPEIYK
ncbi:peptide deformylase [Candidatus Dojkabacteria bacterium]|nr:peptide deformylase [Candidatus Dojkabacteria bacterium]